jgi:hypothetical protein
LYRVDKFSISTKIDFGLVFAPNRRERGLFGSVFLEAMFFNTTVTSIFSIPHASIYILFLFN